MSGAYVACKGEMKNAEIIVGKPQKVKTTRET
jgi:hypothetical protein